MGADKSDAPLAGAALQGWFAPNITTNEHQGIGGWSKDELVQYLKTGTKPLDAGIGPDGRSRIALHIADVRRRHCCNRDLSEG